MSRVTLLYLCFFVWTGVQAQPLPFCSEEFEEFAPVFYLEGEAIIFQANYHDGFRLYQSLKEDTSWSSPTELFPGFHPDETILMGGPAVTPNEDSLFFSLVTKSGEGDMQLFCATRGARGWNHPTLVEELSQDQFRGFPSFGPQGRFLYFAQRIPMENPNECQELMVSQQSKGTWQDPEPLQGFFQRKCCKGLRALPDGNTLVLSIQNGLSGIAHLHYTRPDGNGKWERPTKINFLAAYDDAQYLDISKDGTKVIFAYQGDLVLLPVPENERLLDVVHHTITVVDAETDQPISAQYLLAQKDKNGQDTLFPGRCNAQGQLSFRAQAQSQSELEIMATGYASQLLNLNIPGSLQEAHLPSIVRLRRKTSEIELVFQDAESGEGLSVDISITNVTLDEEMDLSSLVGRDGKYAINLREGDKYSIEVSSQDGYAFAQKEVSVPLQNTESVLLARFSNSAGLQSNWQAYQALPDSIKLQLDVPSPQESLASNAFTIPVTPLKTGTTLQLEHIYFESNSYQLTDASYRELDKVETLMSQNPYLKIEIAAHTDQQGSASYNLKLSKKRAQSVVDYLESRGLVTSNLVPRGYGESKPISGDPALNRRVELIVID